MHDAGYDLDDLMALVYEEGAERLILCPGDPPVIVLHNERHTIEGPPLTLLDTELMFRRMADTRQLRQLRIELIPEFYYRFRSLLFRVTARLWSTGVVLDLAREEAQQDD